MFHLALCPLVGDESRKCCISSEQQQLECFAILLSKTLTALSDFDIIYFMAFVVLPSCESCTSNLATISQRLFFSDCFSPDFPSAAWLKRLQNFRMLCPYTRFAYYYVRARNSADLLEAEYLLIKYSHFHQTLECHQAELSLEARGDAVLRSWVMIQVKTNTATPLD